MSDKYKKLKKNTLIFTIGNIGSITISIIMLPMLTNVLTTNEYGIIDFITITLPVISPFLSLNMIEAILRFGVDKNYDNKLVFSTCISIFACIFLVLFIILITINTILKLDYNIVLISIIIFLSSCYPLFQQFTRAVGEVKKYAISDILYTLIYALGNIVFMGILKKGVNGYFIAYIITNFLCIIYLFISAKLYKYLSIKKINYSYGKEFIKYSLPLLPNNLSWWAIDVSDRYILAYSTGFNSLGIYSISNKIPNMLKHFYGIFFKAWQISAIEEFNSKECESFYSNIFNYLVKVMFFIVMIILLSINIIMTILIGENFKQAIFFIPILLIAFTFYTFSAFLETIYTSSKKTKNAFVSTIIAAGINIIGNIIFIPIFGAIVATISTLIAYVFLFIYRYIDTKKYLNISLKKESMYLGLILVISQVITIFIIDNSVLHFIINIIIIIIYICVYYNDFKNIIYMTLKNKRSL